VRDSESETKPTSSQMANPSAHRLIEQASAGASTATAALATATTTTTTATSSGSSSGPSNAPSAAAASLLQLRHQRQAAASFAASNRSDGSGKAHYRCHQRRQSVARLLPDISKLRLLSWLVEASNELVNCDIAIMDGVYAKINGSQESLLFWNSRQQSAAGPRHAGPPLPPPPPPPSVQPMANKIVISQRKLNHSRNHHSLPITNYDASSLAAISMSPSLGIRGSSISADADSIMSNPIYNQQPHQTTSTGSQQQQQQAAGSVCSDSVASAANAVAEVSSPCENNMVQQNEDYCDSNQSDDDDNSSAASSTESSGINGGSSISSASSASSTSSASADLNASGARSLPVYTKGAFTRSSIDEQTAVEGSVSSAERLSEKIRRTVMEHNYLQNLLVNIIRQHDRQRDLMHEQRRRQMSVDQLNFNRVQQQRIDLADIADALDDGCSCSCHSDHHRIKANVIQRDPVRPTRSSTLPTISLRQRQQETNSTCSNVSTPSRKTRPLKKIRGSGFVSAELKKQDLINRLADKLCENCFETHYWLHGCSIELTQPKNSRLESGQTQDLNAIITKRNATFIKLIQQEVRSTISKSIELIDLIRKEIKSPESIKQKQLMRCFSTSIQLLTSVGNYVVPSQDISTFIPEVGHHQTTLFCLPSSDFDHLLFYSQSINPNQQLQSGMSNSNYHLAPAPDIPIRRRFNQHKPLSGQPNDSNASSAIPNQQTKDGKAEQALSLDMQRLKTSDKLATITDSSSGASSNNSSASSSIARGTVQQSSLTRVQAADSIMDGKTSHGLSFEAIANLSRQQTEDDMVLQSRPRFWQSSKFNFIKKLLQVKQQRLMRQQSKDRRIYNNKVQNKFRLVMMDLTHFNKSQQLLTTENGVNSLLTSMRNVLEFGLYLTLKLY